MAMLSRPAPNAVATIMLLAGFALCLATMSWRMSTPGRAAAVVALGATGAGLLLLAAGAAAYAQRPANRIGLLLALTGCAFFTEDLVRAHHGILHTLGLVLLQGSTPLLLHAVLAFPRGRFESPSARLIVIAAYVVTFGGSLAQAVVDGSSEIDRAYNLLLWQDRPEVLHALNIGQSVGIGVLALLVGFIAVLRAVRAQSGDRPLMILLAAGTAAGALLSVGVEVVDYRSPVRARLVAVFYAVIMAFAIGLMAFLTRFADGLAIVTELARRIGPGQSLTTTEALARRSLHDPVLRLGLLDEETGAHFDGTGAVLPPATPPALARQDYGSVAALYWDNGFVPPSLVVATLSVVDAARAADRAAADVQQDLLRNLHDGAQQRLTALALRLRMVENGVLEEAPAWAQTRREIELASAELRRLARGEAPQALDAGLAAALRSFAARSPVPIQLSITGVETLPDDLGAHAYFVIAEAVTNAIRHGGARHIDVRCGVADGALSIDVTDDGAGGAQIVPGGGLAGLSTRVKRLGGTLSVTDASPTRLCVRLPLPESTCA